MWEFITESGMLKNIYFSYYYKLKRSIIDYSAINLEIQGHVKRLKYIFNQGKTSKKRLAVASKPLFNHRIWDAQKHLLNMLVKLKKRMIVYSAINMKIQQNV